MPTPSKLRLDDLLVARGLAPSRAKAKAYVMAGHVRTGTERLDKPGKEYPTDLPLNLVQTERFVSRGGEKLQGWLDAHPLNLAGAHVLDVGASTGGFTDCALQAGAASVTCIDVGRAQLHGRLLTDPRVTNLEQINARHLDPAILPRPLYDAVLMDLSFISLRSVLPAVWPVVRPGGSLVALVKPQFEAGKAEVDKGQGIIRDPAVRQRTLEEVTAFALERLPGAVLIATLDSPIAGTDGNQEFLLGLRRT